MNDSPNSNPNNDDIVNATHQEILRQIRHSFNLYTIAITTSLAIGAFGGGLLLSGKTTEGAVTAIGGIGVSAICSQLSKESQERLELLLKRLEDFANDN
jgi:hypothetical protein